MTRLPRYIHEQPDWTRLHWDAAALSRLLADVHFRRGLIVAGMASLGFELRQRAVVLTLIEDVTRSSRIEGEHLDAEQVRSSVVRRLGLDAAGLPHASRDVDGVVEMMLDATQKADEPVDENRLYAWHAALFPTGRSGMTPLDVGTWRSDRDGPMQVRGGHAARPVVHFEAPAADRLPEEMRRFLTWLEADTPEDPVLRAALAHLMFLTIHPFEDGNGRIARALADLMLARADGSGERFYSMSAQIEAHRSDYYRILEQTQRSVDLDVTAWLTWFLERLSAALDRAESAFAQVRDQRRYWDAHRDVTLNARQRKVIDQLFEDFQGKLKTEKYARLTKCSTATAQRDLAELVQEGLLKPDGQGGRSTGYVLAMPDDATRSGKEGSAPHRETAPR
jgi:Fic family protein